MEPFLMMYATIAKRRQLVGKFCVCPAFFTTLVVNHNTDQKGDNVLPYGPSHKNSGQTAQYLRQLGLGVRSVIDKLGSHLEVLDSRHGLFQLR